MKKLIAALLTATLLMASSVATAGTLADGDTFWHRLAAQGDVVAQVKLGFMYANGQGVVQDYTEAVKWYKLAAAQGDAGAQLYLGAVHANGRGVVQDYVAAHMWFNLAAAQGDALAIEGRILVEKSMTAQQIAEAQKLARECLARNYKNC